MVHGSQGTEVAEAAAVTEADADVDAVADAVADADAGVYTAYTVSRAISNALW